jgi:hypothetical protein
MEENPYEAPTIPADAKPAAKRSSLCWLLFTVAGGGVIGAVAIGPYMPPTPAEPFGSPSRGFAVGGFLGLGACLVVRLIRWFVT